MYYPIISIRSGKLFSCKAHKLVKPSQNNPYRMMSKTGESNRLPVKCYRSYRIKIRIP